MPKIDLFNKTADLREAFTITDNGVLKVNSKSYTKYFVKSVAEGVVVGAVIGFAVVGALVMVGYKPDSDEEETE